ncbi:MAG: thioredoxin [Spirochaetes bacterium DG_61]|jgi:thioredoxin 2|nr:MAG: thioredoxin [Spirochaetes bacterium DG_61]
MNSHSIIRCRNCGGKNRVLLDKISSMPRCGKCKAPLSIPQDTLNISTQQFKDEVLNETIPTVVDFWAPWCGPCRMVGPILEDIARGYPGRIKVVKVNSDENPDLSAQFQIQGIPTIILFREGREIDRLVGAAPKENIMKFLRL